MCKGRAGPPTACKCRACARAEQGYPQHVSVRRRVGKEVAEAELGSVAGCASGASQASAKARRHVRSREQTDPRSGLPHLSSRTAHYSAVSQLQEPPMYHPSVCCIAAVSHNALPCCSHMRRAHTTPPHYVRSQSCIALCHAMPQLQEAPTYRPTPEEFKDPFAYIASIRPEASRFGICCIGGSADAVRAPWVQARRGHEGT